MKKCFFPLLILICILLTLSVQALPVPGENIYACDEAGVLSAETAELLLTVNAELEQQCSGAQFVVVTVKGMDGLNSDEYAYTLFNDWGVGSASENNGMLLAFATEENRGWLAVGSGITGSFTDAIADNYLNRYFWDSYDAGNYDRGVQQLTGALLDWYRSYYRVSSSVQQPAQSYAAPQNGYAAPQTQSGGVSFASLLFLLVILLLLSGRRTYRRWGHWGIWPFYYLAPWWAMRSTYRPYLTYYRTPANNRHSYNYRPSGGFGGGRAGGGGGRSSGGGFRSSGGGSFGGGRAGGGGGRR